MKTYKVIERGQEAGKVVLEGMRKVVNPIRESMGARGRYTSFQHGNQVLTVNDGYTISQMVLPLRNPLEQIGGDMLISSGFETNYQAGDSTSLNQVGTYEFCKYAYDLVYDVDKSYPRHDVYNALEVIKNRMKEFLDKIAIKDVTEEQLIQTSQISCKETEMGYFIGKGVYDTGIHGSLLPKRMNKPGFKLEDYPGYMVESTFTTDSLFSDKKLKVTNFKDCYVMLYNGRLEDARHVYPIVQMMADNGMKGVPILLFCGGAVASAMENVYHNFQKYGHLLYVMELNHVDNELKGVLEDISAVTGSPILGDNEGLPVLTDRLTGQDMSKNPMKYMRAFPEVIVRRNETILVYGEDKSEKLTKHIDNIKAEIKNLEEDTNDKNEIPLKVLRVRLTKLESKLKYLYFGADSNDRLNTLEFQMEDAINTARLALKEGIIVGGGLTLMQLESILHDGLVKEEDDIYDRLIRVFSIPHIQICSNAGLKDLGGLLTAGYWNELIMQNKGVNIHNLEHEAIDYAKEGIYDSKEGIKIALTKAITTAQQFILTNTFVTEVTEDDR